MLLIRLLCVFDYGFGTDLFGFDAIGYLGDFRLIAGVDLLPLV